MKIKLGDIIRITSGGTPLTSKREYYDNGMIPWVKTGDLKNQYVFDTPDKITQLGLENSSAKIFPINTVLIAMYGATIGSCSILKVEAATNQACAALLPSKDINEEYLYFYLRTIKQKLIDQGVGGGQPNISGAILKQTDFPLIPIEDQIRIANILSKAEALISQRKESLRLLDEFLKSTFLKMFGDPVRNEKGWGEDTIDNVCDEIVDCVNRTAPIVDFVTEYKMIRTTNIRNYKINFQDLRYVTKEIYERWTRRLVPERGDIIFTREAPAGEAAIVDFDDKIFLGQRTMHFRPNKKKMTSEFLLFQLMGQDLKRQIERLSSGSTVKHLSVPACKKFIVKVPPLKLQTQFAHIVEKTEALKARYQTSLQELENLYGSLSQRAFSPAGNLLKAGRGELTYKQNDELSLAAES